MLLLLPTTASAQWVVDAAAGRALYDPVGQRVGAVNVSLGARYQGHGRWTYLAGGTDLGSLGLSWGAGGLGGRLGLLRRGDWELGVNLGGHLYGYSESHYQVNVGGRLVDVEEEADWGATLEAVPTVSLRGERLEVELRSGVVQTMGPFEGELLAVAAYDGGARVAVTPSAGVQLEGVGRYMHFPEGGYPYAGGSLRLSRGPGAVWAFGGSWFADTTALPAPQLGYGVGASVSVGRGVEVTAGWQQESSEPLYLSAPRRTWNVRVSRTLGRPAPLSAVLPPVPAEGTVAIRLPASAAESPPSVLGDFTEWKPVPMVRSGEFWVVHLPISSGVYHYGFRTAKGEWVLPPSVRRVDDGMGGESAVLVVP
ncbi:MAG TPA: glycogen-binding domain-containing protein [Longimicrobiaceae bacterium]|nr:glycogen-binding domain-containing protein [Longimicrobiaceae bacterium]